MSNETTGATGGDNEKLAEPSMGPACLVIAMLTLAVLMAFCAISSFVMFSDSPALAEKGITQALMPWVESSNLAPADKRSIVSDLQDTVEQVKTRKLTARQMARLKSVLEDNPVLLWGNVEGTLARAKEAGLTDLEIESAQRISQRLLRAAAMRKLGRNDLVYTLESCTHTRDDGEGLEVNDNLTAENVRLFLARAEKFVNGMDVPNEAFSKTVPEVFHDLIEEALSVK